jgi:hypothetical protein
MTPSGGSGATARVRSYSDTAGGPEPPSTSASKFTAYHVTISCAGREWELQKRFSDFLKLHAELRVIFPALTSFDFPTKSRLLTFSTQTKERRRDVSGHHISHHFSLDFYVREISGF